MYRCLCCPFVRADSARLYGPTLPVCTWRLILSGHSASEPVVWDNNPVNRDQPDITDLGHDVFQIDTRMAGYQGITAGYLIRGSRPCLVETGTSTSAPIVARALAALGVGADDMASVVVTHIHLDHAGGVGDIAAAYPKAEIVVHQRGARHLADPSALMVGAEMAFGDALDQLFGRLAAVPGDRIRALDDTGVVDLGDGRRLDSYHSPGHASHHVGLIDSGSGDLYVGDAVGVYLPDTGDLRPATPSPDFDLDAALASLTRFRALQPTRLLFSHYGPVSNVPEILDRSAEELTVWVEGTRHARRLGLDLDHAVAMVREQTLARYNAYADGADPAVAEKIEVISRAEVSVGGIWHWLGKMAAVPERADLAGLAEFPPSRWLMSPGARCGRPASSPLLAFVQGEDFVHGDASWDGEDRVGNLMGIPLTPDGKTCIGVVFGGPSAEHQISGASALAVIRGLNADRFRPVAIGVDQDCRWRLLAAQTVQEAVARRADGPAIQDRLTVEGTEVELRRGGCLVAAEAPATVIERLDVVGVRRAAGLQQLLDEIDAAARAVALVAADDIGRAGRGAEAAMHARAQDLFERGGVRIGELFVAEVRLHGLSIRGPRTYGRD